ncbi:short-chain fatty acyl-CoA regulator family protein [Sphingobium sp. H39-3-25]|uniref:helix-turn-helix domain-containing protein n=1 Tax=Sphingobium arseniciresistens TaxID=3030834 RepID=UPI0023B9E9BB|nr:short-chain fatty acyl-CoA regulator family protein [Sphingobium arseniciresistens]
MARGNRIFAGQKLRQLRLDLRMDQAAMARTLGISVSYLSQLENDDRPLTAKVKAALAESFPLDWAAFDAREEEQLLGAFTFALAHPEVASAPLEAERIEKLHLQYPEFAARFVDLHRAYARSTERLNMMEEAIVSDMATQARMPWEAVRDWFHEAGNYVHSIDCLAEDLSAGIAPAGRLTEAALIATLKDRHGIEVIVQEARDTSLRAYDGVTRRLSINGALPVESRAFMIAHQLMMAEGAELIAQVVAQAAFPMPGADRLLAVGLANYAAGALLMPYARYREAARELHHDIDRLARRFGVSFEQACHRLSTLQRPGLRGIPFFFCRVDMAGNITKRHSATRLQFARFGGGCPLWIVHEAVAIPDRILVQLGETPDGVRYVSMAKGLVKPSGTYARAPRRYAVALGCEIEHAGNFIYADGLQLHDEAAATPIGVTCRLCPRQTCDQRAFPPADRSIRVDPDHRQAVPYWID